MAKWNLEKIDSKQVDSGFATVNYAGSIYQIEIKDFAIQPSGRGANVELTGTIKSKKTLNSKPRHTAPSEPPLEP